MGITAALSNYKENSKDKTAEVEYLVEKYRVLVDKAALSISKNLPKYIELEDLKQVGFMGLIKAAKSYEGKNDAKFSTYAYYRIRGSIYDEIRSSDWKPRRAQKRTKEISQAIAQLEKEGMSSPSDEAIANRLEITVPEYYDWVKQTSVTKIVDIDDDDLVNNVSDETSVSDNLDKEEIKEELRASIMTLPSRDAQIVSLYYMEDLSFKDIGFVMDMSPTTCSRIFKSSMLVLRARLINKGFDRG